MKTFKEVLTSLAHAGYTVDIDAAIEVLMREEKGTAWYIQGVAGCGGWIAALFFFQMVGCVLSMLFNGMWEQLEIPLIVLGLVFIGGTVFLRRQTDSIFLTQIALAVLIAGIYLLLFGVSNLTPSFNALLGVALALCIGLIFVYPDMFLRYLAGMGCVVVLLAFVLHNNIAGGFFVLNVILLGAVIVGWGGILPPAVEINAYEILQPVKYAVAMGLFINIGVALFADYTDRLNAGGLGVMLSTGMFGLALLWLLWRVLKGYGREMTSFSGLLLAGLILLVSALTLQAPGILAALFVMLLAYRRRDDALLNIALVSCAAFIIYFYYSLSLSLLVKSFILMGVGVALLVGRVVFQRTFTRTETQA